MKKLFSVFRFMSFALGLCLATVSCEKSDEPNDPSNPAEYVDLGLPSGTKWATVNVGAKSPEDYGDYFAWGEIKPKKSYSKENSVTYGKDFSDIGGDSRYDAARANWGGSWRLPTRKEQDELREKCTWTWTTRNGVTGYQVKSKVNGNSIFIPAAGYNSGASIGNAVSNGYYWSSTPDKSDSNYAYCLYFYSGNTDWLNGARNIGRPVRPVSD